ncbi:Cell cycle checkpoint protein RAD17 isoform X1 [Oopsacas minuta]|uniref:Cell cycle checkpoint protein RAD17 isoform X1 n=1 Tax=Oopsacas minuta TaxID=111878 RepID=A0AAV7JQL5_9METZ|nr:Cell cycle checkpoint protein RAD17 isoform X1 [Oopsacas minuta]
MIGVGQPLRRKRTLEWIDSDLSPDEDSKPADNSMDSDLELLNVFKSNETKPEIIEMKDWCEEFKPESSSELVGNKKQINDLNKFLKYCLSRAAPSILHLSGPPGCGKSTALRVLGNELEMDLVEWNSPTAVVTNTDIDEDDPITYTEGQLKTFQLFLINNKYSSYSETSLELHPDELHFKFSITKSHTAPRDRKKLLIVKDIPNVILRTPSLMQEVLRLYHTRGRHVLAFVVPSSHESSDPYWKLFSRELLGEFGIASICFNAVHNTGMSKVISRVMLQKTNRVDDLLLDEVLAASTGDLRFALNTLHFYLFNSTNLSCINILNKKKLTKRVKKNATSLSSYKPVPPVPVYSSIKNHPLSSLHAIGKVLHAKRKPWRSKDVPASLPSHLSHHTREELQYQPDHVFETSTLSSDLFLSFLHCNLPEYSIDINELTIACNYLSQSDILSPLSSRLHYIPSHYSPYVASIGISHSLTQCVSSKFTINGPIDRQIRENISGNQSLLIEIARETNQYETNHIRLATDLLSYHQLLPNLHNSNRLQQLVSCYKLHERRFISRDFPSLIAQPSNFSTVNVTSPNSSEEEDQSLIVEDFPEYENW